MAPRFEDYRPGYREDFEQQGFRIIGAVTFGPAQYLIRQDGNGVLAWDFINPTWDKQFYLPEQLSKLQPSARTEIPNIDPSRVEVVQLNDNPPKAAWHESVVGADEITFSFEASNAVNQTYKTIDVYEGELLDLFMPGKRNKSAVFFPVDTNEQQLVGIAIRRDTPVLAFIRPRKETNLSTVGGVITFMDNIYKQLSSRMTPLQTEVDDAIYRASLSTSGRLKFNADNTPAGQKRQELMKRIYQIQALLLALKAENAGGKTNQELSAFIPFLAQIGNKKFNAPPVEVDIKVWTSLLEDIKPGFIQTPGQVKSIPSSVALPFRPHGNVQEQKSSTSVLASPKPDQQTVPQLNEKRQAILMAHDIDTGIEEILRMFETSQLTDLSTLTVNQLHEKIDHITSKAGEYMQKRPRKKVSTITAPFILEHGVMNVAGIADEAVNTFLTGSQTGDYKAQIEHIFEVWEKYIKPIYVNTTAKSERMLGTLNSNAALKKAAPGVIETVSGAFQAVMSPQDFVRFQDKLSAPEAAHIILITQMAYALTDHYRLIKAQGDANDIDNWTHYVYNSLFRARKLAQSMKGVR